MKRFLVAIGILILICVAILKINTNDEVHIQVLLTSDIHGAIVDSSYSSEDSTNIYGTSLARIATLIKDLRQKNENTLLIDNGDTIQGTPLTYYYAFNKKDVVDPAMKALRVLSYDVWTLGNHEFNYGLDILCKQIEDISAPDIENESSVDVLAANFVVEGNSNFEPWTQAYVIKEMDGVKVGIIGMDTPAIPFWDKKENWEGIDFKTFLATWNHYASILKDEEGCDIVILSCHSGAGIEHGSLVDAKELGPSMNGEGLYYDGSYDNEIAALIENSKDIDLVFGGHTHEAGMYTINNQEGKEIPVMHCGTKAKYLGVANISYNKKNKNIGVDYENMDATQIEPDQDFVNTMMEYEQEVWDNYLNEVIGMASNDFISPGNMIEPNAFLELVNKVEIETTGAQMAFCSPLHLNDGILIPKGQITLSKLFQLYEFENWLVNIDMTGKEIKEWLEYAATHYEVQEDGSIQCDSLYCDTLYGEGVHYDICLENEEGNRIQNLMFENKPIELEKIYQVAITDFRFTGGGHYIENIDSMEPSDMSRVNYSTRHDMDQGEDLGQVRNLLAQYIKEKRTIDPVTSNTFSVHN